MSFSEPPTTLEELKASRDSAFGVQASTFANLFPANAYAYNRKLPRNVRYPERFLETAREFLTLVANYPNGFDYSFTRNAYGEYMARYFREKGLIHVRKGWWNRSLREGERPRITACESLRAALKDWVGLLPIPVPEIPESKIFAAVQDLNEFYRRFDIRGCDPPVLVRYQSEDEGDDVLVPHGRMYALGRRNYMSLSKEDRLKGITIDGARVVECDVSASYLSILIGMNRDWLLGRNTLISVIGEDGTILHDPYLIDGIDPGKHRDDVKMIINLTIQNRRYPGSRDPYQRALLRRFKEPILTQYPFLENIPEGLPERICYMESQAIQLAIRDLKEQGICGLDLHDGIIVPEWASLNALRAIAQGFMSFCGVNPIIKEKRSKESLTRTQEPPGHQHRPSFPGHA